MTTTTDIPETRAAAWGTLSTLVFRLVSFVCTQATFRLLQDPTTLGKAGIQLELLLTTVLFISREGFRLALTRNVSPETWNVAWLTLPVVLLVSGTSVIWHVAMSTNDPDYRLAGILYCLASLVEGSAEPAVLYFLRNMNVAMRASAEGLATVAKTFATFVFLQLLSADWHVTAFGLAQLVYATIYSLYLYSRAWSKLERPTTTLDKPTCYMVLVFTLQGFFKHLLTEADRIVLASVSDSYNQGVYAMGSSYGGMAARILLQPLEENARLLWSRLASREVSSELEMSYVVLVKVVLYIGLLFSCIAVNYTNLLLSVLAGRTWGSNPEAAAVLSAFCVYTAFLACNGMTEAFVYAVASSSQEVGQLGIAHTVTGVIFAVSAFFLVSSYGTIGLVAANCIAMSARSLYSLSFAARYFGTRDVKTPISSLPHLVSQISPHPTVLVGFAISFIGTSWSLGRLCLNGHHQTFNYRDKEWLLSTGQHLVVGITCAIGTATLAFLSEREFFRKVKLLVRQKQE